jgi:molecular chaperone DnaJ
LRDPYDILGVDRSDDAETIKRAYRRLAFRYHPDRNADDPEAAEQFRRVCEAYERIDPEGRSGSTGNSEMSWPDVGLDTLARAIDAFHRGWRPNDVPPAERPRDGRDRQVRTTISFAESLTGTEARVQFSVRRPCDHCQGQGGASDTHWHACGDCGGRGEQRKGLFGLGERVVCSRCRGRGREAETWCPVCRGKGVTETQVTDTIDVPAGVTDGRSYLLRDRGEPGLRGGDPGDLTITVDVRDNDQFSRRGQDIITEVDVPFSVAVLGGEVGFETPTGSVIMDVPEGTSDGQRFRLEHRGFPDEGHDRPRPQSQTERRGHLIAIVRVEGSDDRDGQAVHLRKPDGWSGRVMSAVRRVVGRATSGD